MAAKRKKPSPSAPHRVYTTRQIMEITEQRRQKEEAANRKDDPKAKIPIDKPALVEEDLKLPPTLPVVESPEIKEEFKEQSKELAKGPYRSFKPDFALTGRVVLVLLLTAFLLLAFFEFPKSWEYAIADRINTLIVYGSSFVLNIVHGQCTVEGAVLNTHYYKISMQGDLVVFYSLELLILFALLFSFFQKTTWIRTGMIFISLVPLAIIANIFRVLWACGLALNYGTASADGHFHGALTGFVFIFIITGLTILEFMFFPE